MQDKNEKEQLEITLTQLVRLSKEMILQAGEQRAALKERDMERFELVTKEYTRLGQEFNTINNRWKSSWVDILSCEKGNLNVLKDELAVLMKELKELNLNNLVLIKASSEVMRSVINLIQGESSTLYGELGGVVDNCRKPLVLDRIV